MSNDPELIQLANGRVLRPDEVRMYERRAGLDLAGAIEWADAGVGPYDAERAIKEGRTAAQEKERQSLRAQERDQQLLRERQERERDEEQYRREAEARRREAAARQRAAEEMHHAELARRESLNAKLGAWADVVSTEAERDQLTEAAKRSAGKRGENRLERLRDNGDLARWLHAVGLDDVLLLIPRLVDRTLDVETVDEWLRLGYSARDVVRAAEEEVNADAGAHGAVPGVDGDTLLDLTAMGELLGVKPVTMRMWRTNFDGSGDKSDAPPFPPARQMRGRSPLFSVKEVREWMQREDIRGSRRSYRQSNRAVQQAPGRVLGHALVHAQATLGFEPARRFAAGVLLAAQLVEERGGANDPPTSLPELLGRLRRLDRDDLVGAARELLKTAPPSDPGAEHLTAQLLLLGGRRDGGPRNPRGPLINEVLDQSAGQSRSPSPTSTPADITRLIAAVAAVQEGEVVVDPACGEGALLAACVEGVQGARVIGWERDEDTWELAVARLHCWEIEHDIRREESEVDVIASVRPSVVIADPSVEVITQWVVPLWREVKGEARMVVVVPEPFMTSGHVATPPEEIEVTISVPAIKSSGAWRERQVINSMRRDLTHPTLEIELRAGSLKPTGREAVPLVRAVRRILDTWRSDGLVRPEDVIPGLSVRPFPMGEELDYLVITDEFLDADADRSPTVALQRESGIPAAASPRRRKGTSEARRSSDSASVDEARDLVRRLSDLIESGSEVGDLATAETRRALRRFEAKLDDEISPRTQDERGDH
jgi:hypothetical protein